MKPSLNLLRSIAYRFYVLGYRHSLARLFSGKLQIDTGQLLIRRLNKNELKELDCFLRQGLNYQDLEFAGIKKLKLNYRHPGFLYFGIMSGDELAALWWIEIRGRRTIEPSLAVARPWRGKGILESLTIRHKEIYARHKIKLRYRVNENNAIMIDYYKKKGIPPTCKEGHLYVYEIIH